MYFVGDGEVEKKHNTSYSRGREAALKESSWCAASLQISS